MKGTGRRDVIIDRLKSSAQPVSGKLLAEVCEVSRQIIVRDIALIRAEGFDIISTSRGYVLHEGTQEVTRIFKVYHSDEQMEDELYSIVDLGGKIVNVMVNHRVYGKMEADLSINSRRKVDEYMDNIRRENITSNYHYHEIEAESEEVLDEIENMLRGKGYLVEK